MNKCYRIFTEDKNRECVAALVAANFDGFTMSPALGYWKGVPEKALVIEILAEDYALRLVRVVCEDIKFFNEQESILLQVLDNNSEFI
jgi:hypothetical protein